MSETDIAVITTGSELLNGDLNDTNTGTIARSMNQHGFRIRYSLSAGDREQDICQALYSLVGQVRAIIVTGGLGSTGDDVTARAAARLVGRPLVLNEEALQMIRNFFARRDRSVDSMTERQAMLPQKAVPLPNSRGTAPGFWLKHRDCQLFFIPGVPQEMQAMLDAAVIPALTRTLPAGQPQLQRQLKLFGLPEPKVAQKVPYADLPEGIEVAFGIEYPLVLLKLRATGDNAENRLDDAEHLLMKALGDHIVAREQETHAGRVGRLLTEKGLTLSLAESCTGGLIAQLLTREPGASNFLERGAVTYADSAKLDWLRINPELLRQHGAVSRACALAMAQGIRQAADTELALAVTGIAGPDGGTPEKPVGTVFLALSAADTQQVQCYRFNGSRHQVQLMTAHMALEWLRRYVLEN